MRNYLCKKDYKISSCDVTFVGICNAMNASIIIHQAQTDGTFMEIRHPPGCPSTDSNHEIHLVRVLQDAGSHYSTLIQAADQSERLDPDFANLTLHFPPELVKRHPKAALRKQRKN